MKLVSLLTKITNLFFFLVIVTILLTSPLTSGNAFADKNDDKNKNDKDEKNDNNKKDKDEKNYNNPFKALWDAIANLQAQINAISLIPGPQGPKGDTGPAGKDGKDGSDGATGPQGPAGTSQAQSCSAGQFVTGFNSQGQVICASVPTNQAPVVSAGSSQTITLPISSVILSGTVSDDGLPTGSTLTVSWSKASGPGTVTFSNPNAVSTTATFSEAGSYVLQLSASDTELSSSDSVTIFVSNPAALRALQPTFHNFGKIPVGTGNSKLFDVTLTNVAASDLVLSVTLSGPNSQDFSLQNGCTILAGQLGCQIDVNFIPSTTGDKTASLTVSLNGITLVSSLTGLGI